MTSFICPLCRRPLTPGEKIWRCEKSHSFDVAREGYVNLLPVQHKKSRDPGDDAQMVIARREFLQAGHYQPLRDAILKLLTSLQISSLLDIGCGEGYYTSALTEVAASVTGLDIARSAIRLAAKRHADVTWLVGSGALLPLADASVDLVSNLFTQLHVDEIRRALKLGGYALVVTPAAEHLWSVREQLFDQVRAHDPSKFLTNFEAGFELQSQQQLHFDLNLTAQDMQRLLQMTPYAWTAPPERRAALIARGDISTQAAMTMLLFRRSASI